jgi:hypothetical protein
MIRINYQLNVQISGGPRASHAGSLRVGAYDAIRVTVPAETTDLEIELQPASSDDQVTFLMITANRYTGLTYTINEETIPHTLDAPQLLLGGGGVSLLDAAPQSLSVSNNDETSAASIEVLVGRDPIAPQS